ncbi:MAG: hypothetical protein MZV64_08555 [Ignavibacteriales bacterium]|nr:hypothetical protein [Ignavibacteriales bacterium]
MKREMRYQLIGICFQYLEATKLYSVLLNQFNEAGPIPEGMSATSALRHEAFKTFHNSIKKLY